LFRFGGGKRRGFGVGKGIYLGLIEWMDGGWIRIG